MADNEKSSSLAATAKGTAPSSYKKYSAFPPIFQAPDQQTEEEMRLGLLYDEGNQGEAYNPDYLYGGENYHKALSDVVGYVWRDYAEDGLSVLSDVVVKVTNALVKWANLLAGAWVFAKAGRDAKDPVSRMMADMTAMMLRMLLQQAMEEQRRREREAAERRLYESRRNMWDAEKRLKSAEKALAHEDEREEQAKRMRLQEREDKAARRAGGRVKYGADADKQYE